MCAYSLDHITPSRLGIIRRESYDNVKCYQGLWGPALASTTRLDLRPENARYVPIVKERALATMPGRFKSLCVCADHSDVRFGNWWVWEDSNHRPRPYQGRALTT